MIAFFGRGYFPASGYRTVGVGSVQGIAEEGDLWSSSTTGVGDWGSIYLYLRSTNVSPMRSAYRTAALPVRCVQAFTSLDFNYGKYNVGSATIGCL